jgi:predicted DNA-binding antitoxin AbrB/MazE fold protein
MEIEVIYENGVFRPVQKIDLKEGITMKIPMRKLAIPKYYKSVPIEIDEAQIEEARMEMLERE